MTYCLKLQKKKQKNAERTIRVIVASLSGERQGALVVTQVDEPVRRGRLAAPLTFDLGAQREHIAEAAVVEARIGRQAENRVQQRVVGLRGDVALDLQPVRQKLHALGAVRRR